MRRVFLLFWNMIWQSEIMLARRLNTIEWYPEFSISNSRGYNQIISILQIDDNERWFHPFLVLPPVPLPLYSATPFSVPWHPISLLFNLKVENKSKLGRLICEKKRKRVLAGKTRTGWVHHDNIWSANAAQKQSSDSICHEFSWNASSVHRRDEIGVGSGPSDEQRFTSFRGHSNGFSTFSLLTPHSETAHSQFPHLNHC